MCALPREVLLYWDAAPPGAELRFGGNGAAPLASGRPGGGVAAAVGAPAGGAAAASSAALIGAGAAPAEEVRPAAPIGP